jgi:hypothetical protein
MDANEFHQWLAYHSVYPIGGEREDYRNAILCQVVQSQFATPQDAEDFIPHFGEPAASGIEAFKSAMNAMAANANRKAK